MIAENYRRESRAARTPIDAGAELLAQIFFAMTEQVIHLRRADPRWDRTALVDFLAEFIEGGLAGVRAETWAALEDDTS
ncbi:MAG: hypothetical protein V9E94_21155 [Microthrixaceae bacterium]